MPFHAFHAGGVPYPPYPPMAGKGACLPWKGTEYGAISRGTEHPAQHLPSPRLDDRRGAVVPVSG